MQSDGNWCYSTLQFSGHFFKTTFSQTDEKSVGEMVAYVRRLEEVLKQHKNGFLGGDDAPGAVDFLLWPWFERLDAVKTLKPGMIIVSVKFSKE